MTKCETYNDKKSTFFCALDSLNLRNEMTRSAAAGSSQISFDTNLELQPLLSVSDWPDMSWLAPLVVRAFFLRNQILGENGDPPMLDFAEDYSIAISDIARRLMPLPLSAMKIAKQVATDPIWIDISYAVAAHYKDDY